MYIVDDQLNGAITIYQEKLFIHILDMYVRNNKNFKEI